MKETPQQRWRRKNPDYKRRYYRKNRTQLLAKFKAYRLANRDDVRRRNKEQYNRIRKTVLGRRKRCDICLRIRTLHIDHKHGFCGHKQVGYHCPKCRRGLLCRNCNVGIGYLSENLKLLGNGRAGQYVARWGIILKSRKRG